MPPFPTLPDWVELEHQVAHILQRQEEHGWYFDTRAAYELESTLRREMEEAIGILRTKYGFVAGALFTPKRNNRTQGYVQGCPFTKLKQQLETDTANSDRKTSNRRNCIKGYWVGDSPTVSSMSRYSQEIGDDLGRRERMAEACYDV